MRDKTDFDVRPGASMKLFELHAATEQDGEQRLQGLGACSSSQSAL